MQPFSTRCNSGTSPDPVPADPARLRFFCDESVLGLGKALERARSDVIHPGHRLLPEVPTGTLDPDWMPIIAARGLVVIDRDRRIRTKLAERESFRAHRLKVVWLAGKRDLGTWDQLALVVRQWPAIERLLVERPDGPWFMALSSDGLREIPV
jgi:PIN like domain